MAIFSEQWFLLKLQVLAHCACYLLNRHDTIPAAVFSNWEREVSKRDERLYLIRAETVWNPIHFGASFPPPHLFFILNMDLWADSFSQVAEQLEHKP